MPPAAKVCTREASSRQNGSVHDNEKEDEEAVRGGCARVAQQAQAALGAAWARNKHVIRTALFVLLILFYSTYFAYAMYFRFGDEGSIRLLWVTCTVIAALTIKLMLQSTASEQLREALDVHWQRVISHGDTINWITVGLIYIGCMIYVIVNIVIIGRQIYNLVSLSGIVVYVFLFYLFSYSPQHVNWRTVTWGLALQLLFALLILQTNAGYVAFSWMGKRVSDFQQYSDAGAAFVFGEDAYKHHFFAFKVTPVVVLFSTAVSVLFYLGVMQAFIRAVAWVMQFTMGTTAAESVNAAANIFIGQSEAPLIIKPLLNNMTNSELHAVMAGGMATIAGSVMASYILFGVPANHLLTASVMSAPAALAMSKLVYPETETTRTLVNQIKFEASPEKNLIEAASNGASQSIKLVANIIANLIAFIAMLTFCNATLTWFGQRVGVEELTLQMVCSYVLWPFALVMGVPVADCRQVAALLGIKTILNEYVGYVSLSGLISNRHTFESYLTTNGTWYHVKDDIFLVGTNTTLVNGVISVRAEIISTYALCGFSNFTSIGVMLGSLGSMAPDRKPDMAKVALRAMMAGNVACFMTACIAGLSLLAKTILINGVGQC